MKEGKSEKLLISPKFKVDDKGDSTPSRKQWKKGEVIIKWVCMVIRFLKKIILFTRNMMICATEIRKYLPPIKADEENCGINSKLYPQQHPAE